MVAVSSHDHATAGRGASGRCSSRRRPGELLAVVTEPPAAGVEPNGLAAVMLRGAGWRPSSGPRRTQVAHAPAAGRASGSTACGSATTASPRAAASRRGRGPARPALRRRHRGRQSSGPASEGLRSVLIGNCFGARTALAPRPRPPDAWPGSCCWCPRCTTSRWSAGSTGGRSAHFVKRLRAAATSWPCSATRSAGGPSAAPAGPARRQAAPPAGGGPAARRRRTHGPPEWVSRRLLGQLDAVARPGMPVLFVLRRGRPATTRTSTAARPAPSSGRILERRAPASVVDGARPGPRAHQPRHPGRRAGRHRALARSRPTSRATQSRPAKVVGRGSSTSSTRSPPRAGPRTAWSTRSSPWATASTTGWCGSTSATTSQPRLEAAGVPVVALGLDAGRAGRTWPLAARRLRAVLRRLATRRRPHRPRRGEPGRPARGPSARHRRWCRRSTAPATSSSNGAAARRRLVEARVMQARRPPGRAMPATCATGPSTPRRLDGNCRQLGVADRSG